MARTDPTIYLRIPQELKEALDDGALENNRSLTAEAVSRLTASFAKSAETPQLSDADLERIAMRVALSAADVERIAVRVVQLLQSQ